MQLKRLHGPLRESFVRPVVPPASEYNRPSREEGTSPVPKETTSPSAPCRFCEAPLVHTFVNLGMSPLCQTHVERHQLNEMEAVLPSARLRLRPVLPGAASGVREPGEDLHRVRLLLVLLGHLGGARQGLHRDDCRALRSGPRQPGRSRSPATTATCCSTSSQKGIPVLGIEPAANVAAEAAREGHPDAWSSFFGTETARELAARGRPGRPAARQQRARPRARPERLRRRDEDPA